MATDGARLQMAGPFEVRGRCQNRNAPERMQRQEVFIAGNNKIRFSIDGELEKLVVPGITAGADNVDDRYDFGDASEQPEELLALFYGEVWVELGAGQDIGELLER